MSNAEKDKRYEFIKLCSSLTKQGFRFNRAKDVKYGLVFEPNEIKRIFHPNTRTPFVNSYSHDTKTNVTTFDQWADKRTTKSW